MPRSLSHRAVRGVAPVVAALIGLVLALPPSMAQTAAQPKEVDALATLYLVAATAHVCDLDITDDEDEKLQEAVDRAEDAAEAAGLAPDKRDGMWNAVVADVVRDKAKVCEESAAETLASIRALKD